MHSVQKQKNFLNQELETFIFPREMKKCRYLQQNIQLYTLVSLYKIHRSVTLA